MSSVKYQCSCGRSEPLELLYFCDSCRKVLCKHPSCSFEEIESYYCPGCLDWLPSIDAMQNSYRCNKCLECPCCEATLNMLVADATLYYGCGYCRWDSRPIGLVEGSAKALTTSALQRWAEVKEQRCVPVLAQRFQSLAKLSRGEAEIRSRSSGGYRSSRRPRGAASMLEVTGAWKWDDVDRERELRARQLNMATTTPSSNVQSQMDRFYAATGIMLEIPPVPAPLAGPAGTAGDPVARPEIVDLSGVRSGPGPSAPQHFTNQTQAVSMAQSLKLLGGSQARAETLLPVQKSLRPKRSRRCLQCLSTGLPGLLLKPQVHPLHGDSSGGVHVGKWFKKQSLARYVLPGVSVCRVVRSRGDGSAELLLRFTNPAHMSQSQITSDMQLRLYSDPVATVKVAVAEGPFVIPAIDEVDADEADLTVFKDDPKVVASRDFRSVCIKVPVLTADLLFTVSMLVNVRFSVKESIVNQDLKLTIVA